MSKQFWDMDFITTIMFFSVRCMNLITNLILQKICPNGLMLVKNMKLPNTRICNGYDQLMECGC